MSGPIERSESRTTTVGGLAVRRALPRRGRRTVGPWCFVDHFGPATDAAAMRVGPHPHIGLQTVTWLVEGEVLHHDSIGSEQLIRPGQLNLMTAGNGVAHAEESPARVAGMHGAQLWVAQPDATRQGPAAFEHHPSLPVVGSGQVTATVLVGRLGEAASPARSDSPMVGAALAGSGRATLPLQPGFEHALVVLDGRVDLGRESVAPGELAYLGDGREQLALELAPDSHALLLGGEPFPEPLRMWWNFVARTQDELDEAARDWNAEHARFGAVASGLDRVPAPAGSRG